ncbi:hypothetical protein IFM89_015713 [Coptis chinensis]|uniref:Uncharacterized protein n=1 Tax=Coptis chinensis TaxID=261450 RepID=A0A835I9Y7_9MAGN|nr:hypothetical protein IFM89_015713 [Coptis chinensis]
MKKNLRLFMNERMDTHQFAWKCWKVHKAKQYELSITLEEKEKECIALKDKLGMYENDKIVTQNELREYKVICDVLKEKLTRVEESCELEKSNKDQEEKLTKLNEENAVLKCEKRKAEDELEAQNERYKPVGNREKMLEPNFRDNLSQGYFGSRSSRFPRQGGEI